MNCTVLIMQVHQATAPTVVKFVNSPIDVGMTMTAELLYLIQCAQIW